MKNIKTGAITAVLLLAMSMASFAQLASRTDLTTEEIYTAINALAAKNDDEAKAQLLIEAKAFAATDLERNHILAASLYNFLGDTETSLAIRAGISEKFPDGVTARDQALMTMFPEEEGDFQEIQTSYKAWLERFPREAFEVNEQYAYLQGASLMARAMIKEGKIEDLKGLMTANAASPEYYSLINNVVGEMHKNQLYNPSLPLLENAVEKIAQEENETRIHHIIKGLYAASLVETGNPTKGIEVAQNVISSSGTSARPQDVITLSRGYVKLGQNQQAFDALEGFLINFSVNDDLIKELQPLYYTLNGDNGNYEQYIASLDAQILAGLKDRYQSTMVRKEAPDFSMQNMQGEMVSLKDLKGKIVVLDFWATWCGPCIISFPGMQAAVNKYENDPEVEFLFVNTWQNEENYKELVTDFIAENNYSFHVIYDEMEDRANSTVTAYGVQGIPTKVFIDKEGFIRFQSSGGSADVSQVVGEMEAKIELIKEQAGE